MKQRLLVAAVVFLSAAACGTSRTVDGRVADCGTCHGFPPASPHPQPATTGAWAAKDCAPCHPTSVDAATGAVIPVSAGGTHANGKVEAGHGYFGDYPGGTTSAVAGSIHGPAAVKNITSCKACHGATFDGSATAPSCNACHATNGHADWQADCAFCHKPRVDAPNFHTRISAAAVSPPDCSACHGAGYSETSKTVNAATHMNGTVDIPGVTCTSCHGTGSATVAAPRNAAPPVDVLGGTNAAKVGQHASHLDGGTFANGFACATCHTSVGSYGFTHANGTANVTFTAAVKAGGSYNAASGACNSVYCHGNFTGGTSAAPTWNGAAAACGDCHGIPPATGKHPFHMGSDPRVTWITCSSCHNGYATTRPNSAVTVNKAAHVNGKKDVDSSVGWNGTTCSNSCHGTETW